MFFFLLFEVVVNLTRSTIAVDPWDSKVKEQDISLTKKFCITISIQKISSIHKFIIKIQQFLGYHELKKWSSSSKIIESTFSFPEFTPAWKKSLYSICSFLSSVTRPATSIFDYAHPKKFSSAFNFCDYVSTCTKSVYFICSFFRYSPITRLATPIFDHAHPKNFQSPTNLCEIVPACKKSVNHISSFLRYSQFYSPETRLATLIFDHAPPKTFQEPSQASKIEPLWEYGSSNLKMFL